VAARKVCVVTGSRAEYGLLYWLLRAIEECPELTLQLAVTGMHLSPQFGLTYQVIEQDGFRIDARVEMPLSSDSPVAMAKSLGVGVTGFADALARLRPDVLVVLGDRYEILAAALPAMMARIPIAHIHGGEATEGAIDEAVRHAVTKMAQLHFVATDAYRRRVIQLGEQPASVFVVGGLGIDNIARLRLLGRDALEQALDFRLGPRNLLVTFHPATLEADAARGQFAALLQALSELSDTHVIFTQPNAETESRVISQMVNEHVAAHAGTCKAFTSLGQLRYLSALRLCDGVVGNSSSGLIEAPSLKRGTVNIGDRQRGRLRAASVIDCEPSVAAIRAALQRLFSAPFQAALAQVRNPYGDGGASERIVATLRSAVLEGILKKRFHDLPVTGVAQ
jgi:GDP/UDP-N,N'-diacetylbacillosamine 2-epimerase (hydrolysing)